MDNDDWFVLGVIAALIGGMLFGGYQMKASYDKDLVQCARAYNVFECEFNAIPKGEKI